MDKKEEVTRRLVDWHFRIEPGLKKVYRFFSEREDAEDEPIKLLEISEDTFATGRVDTFTFVPAGDIPYPSRIATITPEEMRGIQEGRIALPKGWDLAKSQPMYPKRRRHRISSSRGRTPR
jgi:hypothetical protein